MIGDRIAVMQEGRFQQVGTPLEIYNAPASRAVARFIGDFNVLEPGDVQRVFGRASDCAWAIHPEALGFAEPGAAGKEAGPVARRASRPFACWARSCATSWRSRG